MTDVETLDSLCKRLSELQKIQLDWLELANSGKIDIVDFSEMAFGSTLDFKGMTDEMDDLILRIEVLMLKNKT